MSDLIPISAKMVGDTGYRKMYLARHVEKRIAAFEARVAELEEKLMDHKVFKVMCPTSQHNCLDELGTSLGDLIIEHHNPVTSEHGASISVQVRVLNESASEGES